MNQESSVCIYKIEDNGIAHYYAYYLRSNLILYDALIRGGLRFKDSMAVNNTLKNKRIRYVYIPLPGIPEKVKSISPEYYLIFDYRKRRFLVADEALQEKACKKHSINTCLITGEFSGRSFEERLEIVKYVTPYMAGVSDLVQWQRFLEKKVSDDTLSELQLCILKNRMVYEMLQMGNPKATDVFSGYFPKDFTDRLMSLNSQSGLGALWQLRSISFFSVLWKHEKGQENKEKILKELITLTQDTRSLFPTIALLELRKIVDMTWSGEIPRVGMFMKDFQKLCDSVISNENVSCIDRFLIKNFIRAFLQSVPESTP
ncbi:MAG: hypothetical protein LBS59_05855 [Puniceicoccales bacterium]|nr:hypothetical protein [Puniceicoccales bacterium]